MNEMFLLTSFEEIYAFSKGALTEALLCASIYMSNSHFKNVRLERTAIIKMMTVRSRRTFYQRRLPDN